MKKAIISGTHFLLFLFLTSVLIGKQRVPVKTIFLLSPDICRRIHVQQNEAPIRMQVLAMNLNRRRVEEHQVHDFKIQSDPGQTSFGRYESDIALSEGKFVLEYLLFDVRGDQFQLAVRNVTISKFNNAPPTPILLVIKEFPHHDFRSYKRSLVYRRERPIDILKILFLWSSISNLSHRPSDERDDLYLQLKLKTHQMNHSAVANQALEKRYGRRFVAVDALAKMLEVAVHTDNMSYIANRLGTGKRMHSDRENQYLTILEEEAKRVDRICKTLFLNTLISSKFDGRSFENSFSRLDEIEQRRVIQLLVQEFHQEMYYLFFGDKTVRAEDLVGDNPFALVRKIQEASRWVRR